MHGSPVGAFSGEEGSAVRRQGLESGTSSKTSACDVVLLWLISRQHAFAPNPVVKFTVHLLPTASPAGHRIGVHPRRIAQKKTTSQFTSSCFGLAHGSGKWHKEHALSNHAKSESSRVGRDWPVMSAIRKLEGFRHESCPCAILQDL